MCVLVWQLKQMAELDQEKEVLLQGLQMMARGRDWYQQQLQRVQERQRRLGQSRASAVSDTAHPPPASDHPPMPGTPAGVGLPPSSGRSGCPSTQGAGTPPHGEGPPPATPLDSRL